MMDKHEMDRRDGPVIVRPATRPAERPAGTRA
jgi:hypothetical protein